MKDLSLLVICTKKLCIVWNVKRDKRKWKNFLSSDFDYICGDLRGLEYKYDINFLEIIRSYISWKVKRKIKYNGHCFFNIKFCQNETVSYWGKNEKIKLQPFYRKIKSLLLEQMIKLVNYARGETQKVSFCR